MYVNLITSYNENEKQQKRRKEKNNNNNWMYIFDS